MADTENSADILDVRDLIERFEELESEREVLTDAITEATEQLGADEADTVIAPSEGIDPETAAQDVEASQEALTEARNELTDWDDLNGDEFKALGDFLDELKGSGGDHQWRGDWYPVTLIRDSYWSNYVQDYADDIGGKAMREATWPMNCIDWDKAGDELQMDYSSSEYDGVTYWYR